jgi:N-glycosylase/DNA lyase
MPELINVSDLNLAATLECGQAFRWRRDADGWHVGVVGKEIWRLRQDGEQIEWDCSYGVNRGQPEAFTRLRRASASTIDREYHSRLQSYLALDVSLPKVVASFPADDEILHAAVKKHQGLRVLRQEPWECLASFMASSTKQIVQIRQIVELLSCCFGEQIDEKHHAFPSVEAVARASHQQLWDCKLGFRAKNLLAAARMIDSSQLDLAALPSMEYGRALEELVKLPGVGEKIANCTLLFACGFDEAFPIDVWIERALKRIYFAGKRRVTARQLREFAQAHFGPYAGWAQQYLFFSERLLGKHRAGRRQPLLDVGTK